MLTTQKTNEIRRAVFNQLALGKTIQISSAGSTPLEVAAYIKRLVRVGKREAIITPGDGFVSVTEIEPRTEKRPPGRPPVAADKLKYPIAGLEVGESVLVQVPSTEHNKVRKSATARAKDRGWKLSCSAQPDGILVTRMA